MQGSLEINVDGLNDLPEAGKKLLEFAGPSKTLAIKGSMGSGKTTLIKQLCKQLGSVDNFSSPTYAIINEYSSPKGKIFHFDLYRLKSKKEVLDLGIEEYLDSNCYCFIEWPDLILDLIPKPYLNLVINTSENKRYLCAEIIKK
jgi:tRNA threonylcarbamoyladenosine biosynthesis protein TsaE